MATGNATPCYCGKNFFNFYDKKNGDFDTIAVLYIQKGDKRIEVNRFFREPISGEKETYPGWVEINIEEFAMRMQNAKNHGNTNMVLEDIGLKELYNKYMKEKGYSSKKTGG